MNKRVLLCDVDEVLWDMMPTWCDTYNKYPFVKEVISPSSFTSWDISDVLDKPNTAVFYDILNKDSFWDEVVANQDPVFVYNIKARLILLMEYYDLYIVTATNYAQKHKLDLFFDLYDCIDKSQLILLNNKWLLDADIIIDDRAETLQEFAKKGTRCVKINHPWNTWYTCEGYSHFIFAANKLLEEV